MVKEGFKMKKIVPSFRRYSEPCLSDLKDEVDCQRIPPLHGVIDKDGDGEENGIENGVNNEDIDDDWFLKLAKRSERSNESLVPYDGIAFDGSSCAEIPFLFEDDLDFKEKTMRTFRRGIKKIWRRGSATITEADPTNKVVYLGNYLTGWAKGEGCVEKPLHTIWKNYSTSTKPDVQMKLTVTQSGLKAVTKDHGLTEYWSHRITYCSAPENLPRVFCWVYRHEGRKLKQELRCHAVLCSKESTAKRMAATLRLRLTQALSEFKRDKILKQNARLSLANSVYDNPSLPRRKILLSIGSQNYRPPLERSKSAPRLVSIEECLEEEDNSPKSRKKPRGKSVPESVSGGGDSDDGEDEPPQETGNPIDKSDFKLTNLNFVKKLCSSIENLMESTSNYGKKLINERRCSKDTLLALKNAEESILKKSKGLEEVEATGRKVRSQKNVKFEGEDTEKEEEEHVAPPHGSPQVVVEMKDAESDEGSNSLQSNSSWSSDVSSLVTVSSVRSNEVKAEEPEYKDFFKDINMYNTSMERLHKYLDSCKGVYTDETKMALRESGDGDMGDHGSGMESFRMTSIEREETDSFSDEEDVTQQEDDVVSDESGYVELADHIVKRLNFDRKEKDVPYHQIIKSNLLRPRRFETSCLQV